MDLPIKHGGSFHSYVSLPGRVDCFHPLNPPSLGGSPERRAIRHRVSSSRGRLLMTSACAPGDPGDGGVVGRCRLFHRVPPGCFTVVKDDMTYMIYIIIYIYIPQNIIDFIFNYVQVARVSKTIAQSWFHGGFRSQGAKGVPP